MNKNNIPKYRKQTGRFVDRAFVSLNNRRYYLGEYGTEESRQEYRRVLAEWTLNSRQVPQAVLHACRFPIAQLKSHSSKHDCNTLASSYHSCWHLYQYRAFCAASYEP